ncbi:xanthine dehydrogenase family protein molybdopterin-binding subunit [Chelativorans alearense]|uniref:xanthine dehydrogenase family protein molybdopterin-binding subunit n=1 Tax=Chelativorans alearense TaxID=2681495 RepID=UPI001FE78262|nr:molybdopterin cofactor-binding domain-containing protein [Chelativorans alearense]
MTMSRLRKITRRVFLIGAATVAGGVAVGYWYVTRPYANPLEEGLAEDEATFNPYVKIGSDNTITVIAPRAEMGQGISTTLAAFVAEELDVPLELLTVEHGPASSAYYNEIMMEESAPFPWWDDGVLASLARGAFGTVATVLGIQATGGSTSTRDGFDRMRQAGAAARHMLVEAAAKRLGVSASELRTKNATVVHDASGRSLTYGEVALDAAKVKPPSTLRLKDRADWKLLGKPQKRVDMLAKVTGAPIFGVDVLLPDMLFGTVKMNPVYWQKPRSADLSKAEAVKGVVKIVPLETTYGHGFGVIAENTWAAFRAAELIEADWGTPDYPADTAAVDKVLSDAIASGAATAMRDDGNVNAAFADAPQDRVIEADYSVPFLAHTCMEPQCATALFKDGRLEIWAPAQLPTLVEYLSGAAIGVEMKDVTTHTTSMGGSFGRREVDATIYAAIMAKAVEGRPVKAIWTREEDVRHDTFRPAARGRLRARLGEDGLPTALDIRVAVPSIFANMMRRTFPSISPLGADVTVTQALRDQPYAIPNYRVSGIETDLGVPVGFWRSVGASFNCFFHECFLDEIAQQGGFDPIELRRRLMKDFPAALAVVDKVAEMARWGEKLPQGTAKGFAFSLCFGSWVGEVVQVKDTPAGIRIEKVWIAADVGTAIDPGIIEAQLTSGAVYGLSAAMGQEITLSGGQVEQSNFHDFDAMRINQCPDFEVAILENHHKMGGVGESGTPCAIAALANAVSALKGERIRALPISKDLAFA